MKKYSLTILLIIFALGCSPMSQMRYPPSRWVRDNDRRPIEPPAETYEVLYSDILQYQLFNPMERLVNVGRWVQKAADKPQEALNVNNFDEVPDSTWFTNRIGRRKMSLKEFRRGPNRGTGPNPKGPWTVLRGKTVGGTPGLIIKDQRGDRYLLKFEPLGIFNLATGAEMISTKIFYALGYNVPENYIVDFRPEVLRIGMGATHKKDKKTLPLTKKDLDHMFRRMPQKEKGTYRALASKFISGKPMGPFSFQGQRHGDSNDRIPHQHRRELRGYRVFAAFLNHSDSRQANTFDTFIATGPDQKGYLLHYLIDFGSTLGSGTIAHRSKPHLYDYYFNYGNTAARLFTLGAYQPNWDKAYDPEMPSVGLFESKAFDPRKWKPSYPNPAFVNMTKRDAFWAAKILVRLSDAHLAAAVKEGQYENPQVQKYLTKTLIARRDKTARAWFSEINPLDNFRLIVSGEGLEIRFDDLIVIHHLQPKGTTNYLYRIKGGIDSNWQRTPSNAIKISNQGLQRIKDGSAFSVFIKTKREGEEYWSPLIELVLKKEGKVQLMGLRRFHQKSRIP